MNNYYDIGLVGCWYWGNYGSLLNGYAVVKLLRDMGLDVLNIVSPYNGFEPHAKKFFEAVYKKEDISDVLTFNQLDTYNKICAGFVTGSDQIWNYKPNKANLNYDKFFRLDFTAEEKKRVSFATSFGKYIQEEEDVHPVFDKLFLRYNAISVREDEGVDIMRKSYGIEAVQVMEPVLDVERSCWDEIAQLSKYNEKEQYLLTYILDPTPEKRKAIEFYAQKLGMKTVNILDGFSGIYAKNKEKLNLPGTLPNIWCADFLYYFQNAYFVITDSFHGACFSLIYNKPFIAISNFSRGIQRFESLLGKINLMNRLVPDTNIPLQESYLYHMDYTHINEVIKKERERSVKWLEEAIKSENPARVKKIKNHVNNYLDRELCMGCGACVSVCPVNAVSLKEDSEGVYRGIVDEEVCINCGKCKKVCAAIKLPVNLNTGNPVPYACIAADVTTHIESSSGGAFTVLAKSVLKRDGVVCGAAWRSDFTVEHILIDAEEDLPRLQKSKYLQSYMGDTCAKIKTILDTGREVLFCGTPCQVTGLKKFLGKNYNNLLLVDLLCAQCPGAGLFKKYFDENFNRDEVDSYNFRYKFPEETLWNAKSIRVCKKDGSEEIRSSNEDLYIQIYHSCSISLASQCLKCKYQGSVRAGDLTIGDCWGIENYDRTADVSKGVSVIMVNNRKGEDFLRDISTNEFSFFKQQLLENIKQYNVLAFIENRDWQPSKQRNIFVREAKTLGYKNAYDKAVYLSPVYNCGRTEIKENSLKLIWKQNDQAEGYIIEQFKNDSWKRIERLEGSDTTNCYVSGEDINENTKFRIQAFAFNGSTPIYSEFVEIK